MSKPPSDPASPWSQHLSPWAMQALAHWREHRPKMCAELEKSAELEHWAIQAAENTSKDIERLMNVGFTWEEAWEHGRERYLFLPTEEERPEL